MAGCCSFAGVPEYAASTPASTTRNTAPALIETLSHVHSPRQREVHNMCSIEKCTLYPVLEDRRGCKFLELHSLIFRSAGIDNVYAPMAS